METDQDTATSLAEKVCCLQSKAVPAPLLSKVPCGSPNPQHLTVVSRTRAENQMETCGVHLDGTLFLPAQGRTPRVPDKAAKGSRAERSQASSFIR